MDVERRTSDGLGPSATTLATLLGRAFLVFGGAFLLRALTEAGVIPTTAGIILGLGYAVTGLIAAERAAATKPLSAEFHGVTAMLVGLPLIWEASTKFALFSPAVSALVLAAFAALTLLVTGRRRLDVTSGSAAFGTMLTALVAAWSTDRYVPYTLLLIALSSATYWLSSRPGHAWLRWPVAVAAGLSVVAVTSRALATPPVESGALALTTQGLLLAAMQGSLAVRLVILSKPVRFFDVMQALSALVISVGGAALIARGSSPALTLIGAVTAIVASGAYLAAFFRLADRPELAASYHAFAAFGLLAATMALVLMFSDHRLAIAALALAIGTLLPGQRWLDGYASLHSAAYLLTSLAASDLLPDSFAVWTAHPSPWPAMDLVAWITLAAAGGCALMRADRHGDVFDILSHTGRVVTAAVFVLGAGGAVLMVFGPIADAGVLASARTVLLSAAAIGLALVSRWKHTDVFAELVYPVLALGGIRLLLDDFRNSQPSTLFIALTCYGFALLLGPRIAARTRYRP